MVVSVGSLKHALKCKCTQTASCAAIIVPSWPPPTPQADVLSIVAAKLILQTIEYAGVLVHTRRAWFLYDQSCKPMFILKNFLLIITKHRIISNSHTVCSLLNLCTR